MTAPSTQVTTLLTRFGLTTAAEELVPRLTQAGHHAALPALLEVFEAEADARRQRRIARLRRAARLPPGKTFATLDTGRLPGPVVHLRGHPNILKRLLVHVAGLNLGLLLRQQIGVGTPRGLQGRAVAGVWALIGLLVGLWSGLRRLWTRFRPHAARIAALSRRRPLQPAI